MIKNRQQSVLHRSKTNAQNDMGISVMQYNNVYNKIYLLHQNGIIIIK